LFNTLQPVIKQVYFNVWHEDGMWKAWILINLIGIRWYMTEKVPDDTVERSICPSRIGGLTTRKRDSGEARSNILEKMLEDIVLLVTVAFGYGTFFRRITGAEEGVI
jgi:hypothetical protein